jgi:opacity protein-like surface antigen
MKRFFRQRINYGIVFVMSFFIVGGVATVEAGEIELSPFAGVRIGGQFVTDTTPSITLNLQDSLTYGLALGYNVTPEFHLEFMWSRQDSKLTGAGLTLFDMFVDQYHFNFLYVFNYTGDRIRPFFFGGLGWTYFNPRTNINGSSRFSFSFGAGVKIYLAKFLGIRLQGKYTPTYITSDDYVICYASYGRYISQWEFTGGLIFRFGR